MTEAGLRERGNRPGLALGPVGTCCCPPDDGRREEKGHRACGIHRKRGGVVDVVDTRSISASRNTLGRPPIDSQCDVIADTLLGKAAANYATSITPRRLRGV